MLPKAPNLKDFTLLQEQHAMLQTKHQTACLHLHSQVNDITAAEQKRAIT
jgi:hypothetical protein